MKTNLFTPHYTLFEMFTFLADSSDFDMRICKTYTDGIQQLSLVLIELS